MTPQPQQQPQTQGFQKAAMSAVAAVLLAGSIVSVEPAFAAMDGSIMNMDSSFGGSSQLVAARSGGRAGDDPRRPCEPRLGHRRRRLA